MEKGKIYIKGPQGISGGLGCLITVIALGVLFNFGRLLDIVEKLVGGCK